jgi:hypothetical protein
VPAIGVGIGIDIGDDPDHAENVFAMPDYLPPPARRY